MIESGPDVQRGFVSLAIGGRRLASVLAAACLFWAAGSLPLRASEQSLQEKIETCSACHGADGNSSLENIPSLAGQPEIFLTTQIIYFREGLRRSEKMTPQVEGLTDSDIETIATHFSKLPPARVDRPIDRDLYNKGRTLAESMHCGTCHLPDYSGRAQMPRLAGQREDYLAMSLRAYLDEKRGGPDTTMIGILHGLSDEDLRALAHFFALQPTE
jgi:cytochrome c553